MKRRAFLGLVTALPVAVPLVGSSVLGTMDVKRPQFPESDAIELPSDIYPNKAVSHGAYARLMLRLVDRQLRRRAISTMTVGPAEAYVGDTWGTGTFTERIYAFLPDVPVLRGTIGKIRVDKLHDEDLARQIADAIVKAGATKFGRPVVVETVVSCTVAVNRRLALRFVTNYEIVDDRLVGRFDFIGGA